MTIDTSKFARRIREAWGQVAQEIDGIAADRNLSVSLFDEYNDGQHLVVIVVHSGEQVEKFADQTGIVFTARNGTWASGRSILDMMNEVREYLLTVEIPVTTSATASTLLNSVTFREACTMLRGTKLYALDISGHNQSGYKYALVRIAQRAGMNEGGAWGYNYPDRENILLETRSVWDANRRNRAGGMGAMVVGFDRAAFDAIVNEAKNGRA